MGRYMSKQSLRKWFRVQGLGVRGLGFRVKGLGVSGLGFRVWGLGLSGGVVGGADQEDALGWFPTTCLSPQESIR